MAINWLPEMQLLAYPLAAQRITRYSGFGLADDLSLLQRQPDPQAMGGFPPTRLGNGIILQSPPLAVQPGSVENVRGLKWWNLQDEHDGTQLRGYTLAPCRVYYNSLIDYSCAPDPAYHAIRWDPVAGASQLWTTTMPDAQPGVTALAWHSADPDMPFGAVTQLPLPQNQSFTVQLQMLGIEQRAWSRRDPSRPFPYLRLTWGLSYALRFSPGRPAVLEHRKAGGWETLREAEGLGRVQADEAPVELNVCGFAGRLILVPPDDDKRAIVYTRRRLTRETGTPGDLQPVTWAQQPLLVEGVGIPFTLRVGEIQWGTWDEELGAARPEGAFERQYNCNRRIVRGSAPLAYAFGYQADGTQTRQLGQRGPDPSGLATISNAEVIDSAGRFLNQHRYTCTLQGVNPAYNPKGPPPDALEYVPGPEGEEEWAGGVRQRTGTCMAGGGTPFVHSVALRLSHVTQTDDRSPINLRPALERVTESMADPQLQPGSRWTVDLNRLLLADCPVTETGKPVGNNWPSYVAEYHPCTVDAWWVKTDGTTTPAMQRLTGLIWAPSPSLNKYGDWPTQLELRDWAVRLQKPSGVIDGRFAPLDLLAAEKMKAGGEFYGHDAVRYILGQVLGPEMADRLQVYFAADHYPLLRYMYLFNPPNGSGFILPAPFGDSALNWIKQLCDLDVAVFYFGQYKDGNEVKVAPIYGNYFEIMRGAPVIDLTDTVYITGDEDKLAHEFRIRAEPEVDYNRVVVLGHPPQADDRGGGLFPALPAFSREARIESGSPIEEQNIEKTWERTLYVEGRQFYLPNVAGAVAGSLATWLKGKRARHFGIRCRGLQAMTWGWKVRVLSYSPYSDTTLDVNGKVFRVLRLENDWDFRRGTWLSRLSVVDNTGE